MKKIGVFVGEHGNWSFFKEIFDSINLSYTTDVFKERIYHTPLLYGRLNNWAFHNGIRKIMRNNELCFFEWASELLEPASHMKKYCPVITRLHSYEVFYWAPKINWDFVDKIILVSNAMRNEFIKIYPEHAQKTIVVNNGVPLNKFRYLPGESQELNFGMLCSIHPRKGVYEIILMMHKLIDAGYKPKLHIGGGRIHGPDLDEYYVAIERLIEKLNLQKHVILYGQVEDTSKWLQSIDIYISNSYWEGQQVALLEALASGCYCLSHWWNGVEEVLPSNNIYITADDLFTKIVSFNSLSKDKKESLRQEMREIAEKKFDIQETEKKILKIIDEVGHSRNS